MTRVRFAPSPTGHLFVSGARVALANFLHARRHGGHMLLRFDDVDRDRARAAFAETIGHDLQWLGVAWDETFQQSDRLDLYAQSADRLRRVNRIYPCFEGDDELRAKRDQQLKRGKSPIYDRGMLRMTAEQRAKAEANGKRPYWRFLLSARTLEWRDQVMGPRQAKLTTVSDPVVIRADGTPTPLFASVVDDIDTGITHVIRAEDNAVNTGVQLDLWEALTGKPPRVQFAHLPALADAGRVRLARKAGTLSVRALRGDGVDPAALATCLARIGMPDSGEPSTPDNLARTFDLTRLSQAATGFDASQLLSLNRRALSRVDFSAIADRLPSGATETFWLAVRGSLDLLNEVRGWWEVVAGTIVPPVIAGEGAFLSEAEALLPPEPWDESVWRRWTEALAQATGRVGDTLLMPLRLALTGEDQGPALEALLPLIGRARASSRLRIAAA
jgi:glutamyl-tRNA synthetase